MVWVLINWEKSVLMPFGPFAPFLRTLFRSR